MLMRMRYAVGVSIALASGQAMAQCCDQDKAIHPIDSALNQFTHTLQHMASVDGAPDGRMVVAWASRRQEARTYGIFARLTDALGRPIGDEVHINAFMPGTQVEPAVAVADDGSTWIAWASDRQDGDRGSIIARRFKMTENALEAVGGEIAVNVTRAGHQHRPGIASLSDATTMIVWTNTSAGGQMVLGRVFDADGTPLTGEISLAGDDAHLATTPTVVNAGERFVVAWGGVQTDGTPAGIFARTFDATGKPVADLFEVVPASVAAIEPSIDGDAKGNLAIAWLENRGTLGYDAKARRFSAMGLPLGESITIATCDDSWKSGATVAMADDGRFCVSYTTVTGEAPADKMRAKAPSDILAIFFDADGNAMGEPVRVHALTDGRQSSEPSTARRAVWGSRELPAFCWEGQTGQDGSGVALSVLTTADVEVASAAHGEGQDFTREDVAESASIPPVFDKDWVAPPPDDDIRPAGTDFGFQAWGGTGWTPPDPDISVGPNTLVGVVNVEGKIFDKQGNLLFVQDLVPFFAPVGAFGFVFDPIAVYDRHSGRHIIAAVEHTGGQTSWLNVAVSKTSDPQNGTDWWKYRLNTTNPTGGGTFLDYPNMGVDEDAIFITGDYFGGTSQGRGNWVHMFDKAPMLNGQATTMNLLRTNASLRSLGATNHIDADAPGGYFATSFGNSSTQVTLQAITDPNGSPQLSSVVLTVPGYGQPPGAAQQGTSTRISTVDLRIKNGVYRNGSLWLTHNIGVPGENIARVRYYEFAMNGWPDSGNEPELVQSGEIDLGAGIYTFFGDPGVDDQNNVVLQFNRSSASEFVSIQRTFRKSSDQSGTFREPLEVQTSTSAVTSGRWGDYSGIDEDPAAPSTFWAHDEYTRNGWRTWFGQIKLSGLRFEFPNGLPEIIDPSGETIPVEVFGNGDTPEPATGRLFYDLEHDGTFVEVAMEEVSPNVYNAHLPVVVCLDTIDFYFAADATSGETFTSPGDAPASFFSALSMNSIITFADDFEADLGWTTEILGATSGQWQRGVPVNDPGWEYDPTSDGDGSGSAFLTQNQVGNTDVDAGSVRLTSPMFDMSADGEFTIEYLYFLRLTSSGAEDGLLVEVSSNDLNGPWTTVIDHRTDGGLGWRSHAISESDLAGLGISLTDRMRLRYTARDNDPQSIVEAGVDGFIVSALGCADDGCPADLDGDGDADADDFFAYLDLFSSGDPGADIDGDGDIDADDFFAYLDLFAQGC